VSTPEAGGAPTEGTLRLEVVSGNAAGSALVVEERLVIGRLSESLGRLGDDPELSRHHAEISRQADGTYVVEDLASTNGTLVNGTRITAPTALSVNDSVELGGTTLRVTSVPAPAVAPQPDVDVRAATITVQTPPEMREPPPASVPPPTAESPAAVPTPPPAPAPPAETPAPPPVAAPSRPRLELRLVVDPEQGEAEIQLGDESEPIRLSFRDGRWQRVDGGS
jgi:pSer/pThr/pTyr-binding forkhead associated (FHA) protein